MEAGQWWWAVYRITGVQQTLTQIRYSKTKSCKEQLTIKNRLDNQPQSDALAIHIFMFFRRRFHFVLFCDFCSIFQPIRGLHDPELYFSQKGNRSFGDPIPNFMYCCTVYTFHVSDFRTCKKKSINKYHGPQYVELQHEKFSVRAPSVC